ncbi:hypothetical protein [Lysobacter gummosus]
MLWNDAFRAKCHLAESGQVRWRGATRGRSEREDCRGYEELVG